jgi:hypothetical protein
MGGKYLTQTSTVPSGSEPKFPILSLRSSPTFLATSGSHLHVEVSVAAEIATVFPSLRTLPITVFFDNPVDRRHLDGGMLVDDGKSREGK